MNEDPIVVNGNNKTWMNFAFIAAMLVILTLVLTTSGGKKQTGSSYDGDFSLRTAQLLRGAGDVRPERYKELILTALDSYQEAYKESPSPELIRRIGIVSAELGYPAMPIFGDLTSKKIVSGKSKGDVKALQDEFEMWREIYGYVQVPPELAEDYNQKLVSLNLGPAEILAKYQLYVAARQPEIARAVLQQNLNRITKRLMPVAGIWCLALIVGVPLLIGAIATRRRYCERIEEEPEQALPSLRILWASFTAFLILLLGLQMIATAIALKHDVTIRVILSFSSYVIAGLLGMIYLISQAKKEGCNLASIGLTGRNLGKNVIFGAGGYAAMLPLVFLSLLLIQLLEKLFPNLPTPTHPAGPLIGQVANKPVIVLLFLLVSIAAPIIEETFFRGVLYYGLRTKMGTISAILVSGAVFAAVHPQLPLGFLPLFILGIGFAVLLAVSKSLVPSMIAHSINNTLTFFLALFMLAD